MTRIITKVVLMVVVLIAFIALCINLYTTIQLINSPVFEEMELETMQYAGVSIILFLVIVCIGTLIYHVRTLRTISRIYNVYNRDMYNPRPVNKNIKTKLYKIDLVSAILWIVALATATASTTYSVYQFSKMESMSFARPQNTIYYILFILVILLTGSIIELLVTRKYITGYTYLDDDIDSIGN